MFRKLFCKEDNTNEINRFIEQMNELHESNLQRDILHKALSDCCVELYKFTGKIEATPEHFINKVKNRFYIQDKK